MKVDLSILNAGLKVQEGRPAQQGEFDVSILTENIHMSKDVQPPVKSVSLCTPGCGNTGTGNSYCCSC